jgi:hypothetical protein
VPVSTNTHVLFQEPEHQHHQQQQQQQLVVMQYTMNASRSVVELVVRELSGMPGMLLHTDGLPYDFGRLLTPAGLTYVIVPRTVHDDRRGSDVHPQH